MLFENNSFFDCNPENLFLIVNVISVMLYMSTRGPKIYFDNAATTFMCQSAKTALTNWADCLNPSTDSKFAAKVREGITGVAEDILKHCYVSSGTHTLLFTSGATESNCFIVRSIVKAFRKRLIESEIHLLPHIIASATEHTSIMECLADLESTNDIEVTYVQPTVYGNIMPKDVESAIKPTTCLITIMYANNEIPILNDLEAIVEISRKRNPVIPVHSDCVQVFGKYRIDLKKCPISAISASAHKFYGPKGVGLVIIENNLIEGYGLTAEISGTQQHKLRGGTENVPGIMSLGAAFKAAFVSRDKKNQHLIELRQAMIEKLKKIYKFGDLVDYVTNPDAENRPPVELLLLGPPEEAVDHIAPHIVLLSVVKNVGKPFCNSVLKHDLDDRGDVISIGSACKTSSDKASHVLSAIGAPSVVKRGVIRISFGDGNTLAEVNQFIKDLAECISRQLVDIKQEISEYENENSEKKPAKQRKPAAKKTAPKSPKKAVPKRASKK